MELLDIFDEKMNHIGLMDRKEVHRAGYWHQTFHCWFVELDQNEPFVYFQKRQRGKDTFPEMYDITVAGHLLAGETPEKASREVEEEVGIVAPYQELVSLGVVADEIITADFTDREFCHVYLYQRDFEFAEFTLQSEEVSGIYKARLDDLIGLFAKTQPDIVAVGMEVDASHTKRFVEIKLLKEEFVPHVERYYESILQKIKQTVRGT